MEVLTGVEVAVFPSPPLPVSGVEVLTGVEVAVFPSPLSLVSGVVVLTGVGVGMGVGVFPPLLSPVSGVDVLTGVEVLAGVEVAVLRSPPSPVSGVDVLVVGSTGSSVFWDVCVWPYCPAGCIPGACPACARERECGYIRATTRSRFTRSVRRDEGKRRNVKSLPGAELVLTDRKL